MNTKKSFAEEMVFAGRLGILVTLVLLLLVPIIFGIYYDAVPTFENIVLASGLFPMYMAIGISEVFIFTPLLGSSTYITFITGNIMNLKVPVANNAQELMNTTKGTEKSDVITTLAIGVSSMVTIIVLVIGVILITPLQPFMENEVIQGATDYVLPALFGALIIGVLKPNGDYVVKNKIMAGIIPFVLLLIVNAFVFNTLALSGGIVIAVAPITIGIAYLLFKAGKITIVKRNNE